MVEWFKDGKQLEDEGCVVIIDDVDDNDKELFLLVIEGCEMDDFGEYKVVVLSEVGIVDCQCDLMVIWVIVLFEFKDEIEEVCVMSVFFFFNFNLWFKV